MAMTPVLVRVQAKGGKFLGPDAGYSRVTIRNADTGEVLAQGTGEGQSGQLTGSFLPTATRQALVTPQWNTETRLWLSAQPGVPTAGFTATLALDAPTRVEFVAEALADGVPNGYTATQAMTLLPGVDLSAEPGIVLVIPGLRVMVADTAVADGGAAVVVTGQVTMMCGCPIDTSLPWVPAAFLVTASVKEKGGPFALENVQLDFQSKNTFANSKPFSLPRPGDYDVVVTAVQPAEGNVGIATGSLTVPA
jgi:hypothetical protein